jgi:CIC family chloride channel protein
MAHLRHNTPDLRIPAGRIWLAWTALLARLRQSDQVALTLLSVLVGVATGYGAVGFRYLIDLFTHLCWNGSSSPSTVAAALPFWRVMLMPAAGGVLVGLLIQFVSREVKGHGVPEVMESIALREGRIRLRVVPGKALGSSITIGTGGSAGREGPIVQIGSAIGSVVGRLARMPGGYLRILVASGAAGGISATFNTPVAGAIFAAEVILGDFGVSHFTPVVVGSVMAAAVSRSFYGDQPTFHIPREAFRIESVAEFIPYVLLGLLAALAGILFIRMLTGTVTFFDRRRSLPVWTRPAVGGLVIGLMALIFPQVLGVGYEAIERSLQPGTYGPLGLMLLILLLKMLATSLTLGSGGSGGVLSPSLFIGAMLGGAVGLVVHQLAPGWTADPAAYAMVGMGAVLAATTHAPLMSAIMLFELTGNYQIILPLMLTCTLATLVASRLLGVSIYTSELLRRGVVLSRGREVNLLRSVRVRAVLSDEYSTVDAATPLPMLMTLVAASTHSRFFLVDPEGGLRGAVDLADLRQLIPDQDLLRDVLVAEDVANPAVRAVCPDDDLALVLREFERSGVDDLPVVEGKVNGKGEGTAARLIGVVRKNDVIARYNREMLKRDMALEVGVGVREAEDLATVPLGDRYLLAEVPVPAAMSGKTLREIGFRTHYGAEVVLVKPHAGGAPEVPQADTRLTEGEVLLVVGEREAIGRLRSLLLNGSR